MYKMKNRIERGTGLYAENLRTIAAREIEFRLTPYIFNLGIPPHVSGYNYLRDAVIELLLEPAAQVGVTKCVYPSVAAMTTAWNGGGLRRVKGDPQNTILRFHSRPTNKKCIMALAQMMQEQYGNQIPDWYGDAVCSATE